MSSIEKQNASEIEKGNIKKKNTKLEELKEAFDFFDRNKNGCIEAHELGVVMESLGYEVTDEELRDMINEADVDGNKTIEFEEFVRLMTAKSKSGQNEEEEMKAAFKVFDANGDGFITREELRKVMDSIGEELTEQDLTDMMIEADTNGDGLVDYQEFAAILTNK